MTSGILSAGSQIPLPEQQGCSSLDHWGSLQRDSGRGTSRHGQAHVSSDDIYWVEKNLIC